MGVVYLAHDLDLDRLVALKFLRPWVSSEVAARDRLANEARAASALDHRNIAVVYEIGCAEAPVGLPGREMQFIAMGYYPGQTLGRKLKHGALPLREALDYGIQVADGLSRAHEAGILHRDVKPGNVIVTERGECKILDFGLAQSGAEPVEGDATQGTLAYMCPEHLRGEAADARADIWALGALVYEMLAGLRPFGGGSREALIHAILEDAPRPLKSARPDVPDALVTLIDRCLEKATDKRPRSMAEVLEQLWAIEERLDRGVEGRWSRNRILAYAAAALTGLAVAIYASKILIVPQADGSRGAPASVSGLPEKPAWQLTVLPFSSISGSAEIAELGRNLAVTISAGLEGLGEFAVADAATALSLVPGGRPLSLEAAVAAARALGADRFVNGTLVRQGDEYRVDFAFNATSTEEPLFRATVTASEPSELSDLVIVELVDGLWAEEPPNVPSLAAIKHSTSPEARRAYLQGELALARADMPGALAAFERAFEADPSFWWAYWRSMYPRMYRDASVAPDAGMLELVYEHRNELAEPDRRLVEAWWEGNRSVRLEHLQWLTSSFPSYSPGWWMLANSMVHWGPFLGHTAAEAQWALERFLALSPEFVSGWDHLLWVAIANGDAANARRATRQIEIRSTSAGTRRLWNRVLDLRATVAETGSVPPERLTQTVEMILSAPRFVVTGMAVGFVADGYPVAQIGLNAAVRQRSTVRSHAAMLWLGDALAWASRGAWARALLAADRAASISNNPAGSLNAYRIAVASVLFGGVVPAEADTRKPEPGGVVSEWTPDESAERSWLDGVLAYAVGDAAGLESALRALEASEASAKAHVTRSLEAMQLELTGESEAAARVMAALEREIADKHGINSIGDLHPLLATVNRILAARWLRALGDEQAAEWLLTWHEAIPGGALYQAWLVAIGSQALLERAEIAEAAGDFDRARGHYQAFLERFDRPDQGMQPAMDRAVLGLARVE